MKYLKYICLSIILMMTACIGNPGEEIDDNDPEPTILTALYFSHPPIF